MIPSLHALVVEDELSARDYLTRLLRASGRIGSVAVADTVATARRAFRAAGPDVLFVDTRIVVTTALDHHAVDAFDLGAVDYLLKPFAAERLDRTLARIVPAAPLVASRLPPKLVARDGNGLVLLDLDEVLAAEAVDRLAYVHAACGRYVLDSSLAQLEASPDGGWLRVHRNWLVRLAAIRGLERGGGDVMLRLREPHRLRVPVARERAAAVRDMLLGNALGQR